ncbi:MAG: carbohydrate ABC transporter permease [Candidatus Riflebacteria bacterium]|nr:carbohydrate ABC transporter permease [Candidatus Riflebacteria bacterium]
MSQSTSPFFRVAFFIILIAGMIVIAFGLNRQLFKLTGVGISLVMAPDSKPVPLSDNDKTAAGALKLGKAGQTMKSLEVPFSILNLLIVFSLVVFTLKKWVKTPTELRSDFLKTMLLYEVLAVAVVVVLFPFFWMVCTSFKPVGTELVMNENPFDVVPSDPTLENFKKVLKLDSASEQSQANSDPVEKKKNFFTYFLNSMKVATTAAFFVTLFASMAAYVFAKKELPYKNQIFAILMGTMMIPGMMYMVPQFFMVAKMGLHGSLWGMFLPHLASVFGVFMLKQFMETIPNSLLEAARIDGASEWQIFRIVIVPLSMPILLTLFLLTFLFHWSNFLWQLIVTDPTEPLSFTLPVALALFRGQYTADLGLIMSASCFSIVPIAVLFLFSQRYFIEGMTQGAVKE